MAIQMKRSGNFGIATAFEFQLHPVGTILGGAVFYSAAEAEQVIRTAVDYAVQAPDELTIQILLMAAPPQPFIPAQRVGDLVVGVVVCYAGNRDARARVVAPLRSLGTPIADVIDPVPYPGIFALTKMATVTGEHHDVRSAYLRTLHDAAIATIVEHTWGSTQAYLRLQIRIFRVNQNITPSRTSGGNDDGTAPEGAATSREPSADEMTRIHTRYAQAPREEWNEEIDWLWLASQLPPSLERRESLERALCVNRESQFARRELATLPSNLTSIGFLERA